MVRAGPIPRISCILVKSMSGDIDLSQNIDFYRHYFWGVQLHGRVKKHCGNLQIFKLCLNLCPM